MKQIPISSLFEIFCLKLKDKVFVVTNLSIIFFCKFAEEMPIENKYIVIIFKKKNNLFTKIDL